MTMFTLTIKQKIALGFASIGILLIAGSSFFYRSLSKIQTANSNIEVLAVPVQNQSTALQITLLKMAKTESLAYSQIGNDDIAISFKQFKALQQDFSNALADLSTKVANHPQMNQAHLTLEMSAAVEQQSAVAEHINQQIIDIADSAEITKESSQKSLHNSSELGQAVLMVRSIIRRFAVGTLGKK